MQSFIQHRRALLPDDHLMRNCNSQTEQKQVTKLKKKIAIEKKNQGRDNMRPAPSKAQYAAEGFTTMESKEFKSGLVEVGSDVVIWVDEKGEWDAANKEGAWVRGTCVSRVGGTTTQWVVKDTTGKTHHPTFKFNKGKHAGAGKMFCFLVKSDACHRIEDNSEDEDDA